MIKIFQFQLQQIKAWINLASSKLLEKPFKRTISRLYELTSMKIIDETRIL